MRAAYAVSEASQTLLALIGCVILTAIIVAATGEHFDRALIFVGVVCAHYLGSISRQLRRNAAALP